MTLRARLTLFFVGIVVLPLVAAALAFQLLDARQAEARAQERLGGAAQAVTALWRERLHLVEREVAFAAERIARHRRTTGADLDRLRTQTDLDFLLVADRSGAVTAASAAPPSFLQGFEPPPLSALAEPGDPPAVVRARVEVLDGEPRVVIGGRYADAAFARELARATGVPVAVVHEGRPVASTLRPPPPVPAGSEGRTDLGPSLLVRMTGPLDGVLLVSPVDATGAAPFWLVAVAGLGAATLFGFVLASIIARPLERLAEGARRVAEGQLDTQVQVGTRGDIAHVAKSFNTMTEYLRTYIGELQGSRDELRKGLERLGATLRTTLDLEGMLEVILDTSAVTLGAKAGALYLMSPGGRELRVGAARGHAPPRDVTLALSEGIAGLAATGIPVLVPSTDPVAPSPPLEPDASTAVAVPLMRRDRTIGVIALYGRTTLEPFLDEDVSTLASFAGQASVAIENVLLHQEAQQLSITDGLTGVWNRRFMEMTLRKEVQRAERFNRPFSVLMLDIDNFKRVNDEHGHQRGDEALIELTRRLMSSIRKHVDFVGRYGGEEFVIVLPETPCEGGMVAAEKIRSTVRDQPFLGDGPPLSLTVSVGVAAFPLDGQTPEDLIAAADRAMYRAKQRGRDRVETESA